MNTLFFLYSPVADEGQAWLQSGGALRPLGSQSPAALASQHAGAACVVFLPSERCLFTSVAATAQQLRQAGHSLGWLIEEQTGEDVENLQVIAAAGDSDDKTSLLAINRQELQALLDTLRRSGLHVVALLPDLFLLPATDAGWQLAELPGGRVALRSGRHRGAVLESDLLPLMLEAALQESETAPAALQVTSAGLETAVAAWSQAQGIPVQRQEGLDAEAALSAATDWTRHPANFLQGGFAVSRQFALPRGLRIAAIFVAAAFAVQLLSEWVHYGYYRYQASKTEAAATALYRQMFPDERRIVNLRRQLQAHLNDNVGQGTALPALTRIAESLQGSGLHAQRLDFNAGVLTLDVEARALGELDTFRQKLEGQGFRSEIVSANAQGGLIRGRLRVEGGA
ncbi:MAG TPA: type II secretion system protein GspL [Moraxellaceae bacterium]